MNMLQVPVAILFDPDGSDAGSVRGHIVVFIRAFYRSGAIIDGIGHVSGYIGFDMLQGDIYRKSVFNKVFQQVDRDVDYNSTAAGKLGKPFRQQIAFDGLEVTIIQGRIKVRHCLLDVFLVSSGAGK